MEENNDKPILLTAVYWSEYRKSFLIQECPGTLNENRIVEFQQRTMDCFSVPYSMIGKMYGTEYHGNDYDVVFCFPTENDILKAKILWKKEIEKRIRNIERDILRLKEDKHCLEEEIKDIESEIGAEFC